MEETLELALPFDPAVSLLGTHPKESKPAYNRDTYTPALTAALFTITNLWDQP
jgi:hypothetical protein